MKDIKPVFEWAKQNGDANICDRILMKVMPQLLSANITLTSQTVESMSLIELSDELYELILQKSEEMVGIKYV